MKIIHRKSILVFPVLLAILAIVAGVVYWAFRGVQQASRSGENRVLYQAGDDYLIVEALDDDLIHFEFSTDAQIPPLDQWLYTSPMVAKTDYVGPQRFSNNGRGKLETSDLAIEVDASSLCVTVTDTTRKPAKTLTTACPKTVMPGARKSMTLTAEATQYIYGLGEQFVAPEAGSLNWLGGRRTPANEYGNAMQSFFGGYIGNAQFPILYALDEIGDNYALFVDSPYAQSWDFSRDPWNLRTSGKALRWYLLSGADLPDLRQDFMELVGRPPVPPLKMFGLWVSEYGFDNWAELDDKLHTLQANHFPLDGFVMDLQWYGGITPMEASQMCDLTWDTQNFPDPAGKIAELRDQSGVGLMTIEESYIAQNLPEFAELADQGALALDRAGGPATIIVSNWWGTGGMLDWTNSSGADYWHDARRQSLVDMGILAHWTDLGEPEMFNSFAYYSGFPELGLHTQADIHNLYTFRWNESIARGYERNGVARRPFMLARSGTAGMQRFGSSMWSGDIGTNLISLAAHLDVQAHMSLSGMDYFGADIGGFHRGTAGEDLDEIYTKWFAAGALFDTPVRVHTENLCNCKETAPDRVGDRASNLANLRLRYALSPYYYSLAHRAFLYGEPIVPPLVYYYQDDPEVRPIGDEKLIGRDLLAAALTQLHEYQRDVYLPAGSWVNFYTHEWIDSQGVWLRDVQTLGEGLFQLPLYARAGAILPMMPVDEQTMNLLGKRADGSLRDELILRVYASPEDSQFTLYEDDGQTVAYRQGEVRTTQLSQKQSGETVTATIAASEGTYAGAPGQRENCIELVIRSGAVTQVTLNGQILPALQNRTEFEAAEKGWFAAGEHLILAKSGVMGVEVEKAFEFTIR